MNYRDPNIPLSVVAYCAEECERQRSGERSVLWMCQAWEYAFRWRKWRFGTDEILELGRLVEPEENRRGFRGVPVRVGNSPKLAPKYVQRAMFSLVTRGDRENPDEWYREFEEIHPFLDGNGRVGALLYCWMLGCLDSPVHAPDFWSGV